MFLDELAEMPLDVQNKLLRFLQDRQYMMVGSTHVETANVRIIPASSSVSRETGSPRIQDALMGRLGAQPIALPALRDRREDLGRLAAHFLGAVRCERPMGEEVFRSLFLYGWPHNVRELQKVITEAELLSRGAPAIGLDHLPHALADSLNGSDAPPRQPEGRPAHEPTAQPPRPPDNRRVRRPVPSADELRGLLQQFHGNVAQVAAHLGRQWAVVSRTLRRYGIDPALYRAA